MKYRKKPVVIEAYQNIDNELFLTENNDWPNWLQDAMDEGQVGYDENLNNINIYTLEGIMIVGNRDWIIRGIKGELYPCKPDIFEATYEPVE